METGELGLLLEQPEGDRLEFKAGEVRPHIVARILGAFANTQGGVLIWGVEERGGTAVPVGVSDPLLAEEKVRRGLALVSPQPDAAIQRLDFDGTSLIVAQVSRTPGHLYLADGQLLERRAGTTQVMSRERLAQVTAGQSEDAASPQALVENNQVLVEAIGALQEGMADLKKQNSLGRRSAIALGGAAFGALLRPLIDYLA